MRLTSINPASRTLHPLSEEIFGQMEDDKFDELQKDIAECGVQHPLEVDSQNRIICGSQRLRAIKALGLTTVEIIIREELATEEDIRAHLIKDNTLRRPLDAEQMYRAGAELERVSRVLAERRMKAGVSHQPTPIPETLGPDAPRVGRGRVSEQVAKEVGTSATGYKRLKKVMESGEHDLIGKVERGQMTITAAAKEVRARRPASKSKTFLKRDNRSKLLAVNNLNIEVQRFGRWIQARPSDSFGEYASDVTRAVHLLANQLACCCVAPYI